MSSKKVSFNSNEGLDQFISDLARVSRESSKGVYVANLPRQTEFFEAYKWLSNNITSPYKVQISNAVEDDPFDGSGYINVTSKRIVVENPKALIQVLKNASNVEFCPKTDGTAEMTLMYYGLYDKA